MIIDYIDDQRGELKVEVSNNENKESIRTAQLCTQLGQLVIGLVTLALLVISTVSLTYSFLPQIHAKIGEIGILRAYGESRWFIVNRFLMEVALTCVAGFALAILLYSGLVLPYLNALAVERAPTLFEANAGGPLVVEPSGIFYSLIAFGCSLLFVGLVVTKKVRMSPSALLRMAD
jgi:ABC-type antimicrobial peptide transport system permease subunit